MNPFNYPLSAIQKFVVQLVATAVLLATFFIVFDPGLGPALEVCVIALFGVIGVFATKNHSADDVSKALISLAASVLAVIAILGGHLADGTTEKIGTLITLVVPLLVHGVPNRNRR